MKSFRLRYPILFLAVLFDVLISESSWATTCDGDMPTCAQCTQAQCVSGVYKCTTMSPSTTACDDGNPCTYNDHCNGSGTCIGGNTVSCVSTQCQNRSCNGTSSCTVTNLGSTTSCNDGNACTYNDHCDGAGNCISGGTVTCTASDQCHIAGTCTPSTGCSNPNAPNGTGCNDNNACTVQDTCNNGACQGTPITCAPPDQCHTGSGTCNSATGVCSYAQKSNGTACNDGLACTSNDTCQNGVCSGGTSSCNYPVIIYQYDTLGNITLQAPVSCQASTSCTAQNAQCGSIPDGCGNSLNCGNCSQPQVCTAANRCCTPSTCAFQGRTCGTTSDGCGNTLDCGGCVAGMSCGGSGVCICNNGFASCNGGTCNTDLSSNVDNCGACNYSCRVPTNGTPACVSGTCKVLCPGGQHLCEDASCYPNGTNCP
jgi:hypothetical protein